MKTILKVLYWLGWISAAMGALFILFGVLAILTPNELFLGFRQVINFFHAANSFLLLAIFLLIATKYCECRDDK